MVELSPDQIKGLSLPEMKDLIAAYLRGPNGSRLWDIMAVVRGPDSPSERPCQSNEESRVAYAGRRERKRRTGEVLRGAMFGGAVSGGARSRTDITYITLPPAEEWDHYDRHAARAANLLGLEIKTQSRERGIKVKVIDRAEVMRGDLIKLKELDIFTNLTMYQGWFPLPSGAQFYVTYHGKSFNYKPDGWTTSKTFANLAAMETYIQTGAKPEPKADLDDDDDD